MVILVKTPLKTYCMENQEVVEQNTLKVSAYSEIDKLEGDININIDRIHKLYPFVSAIQIIHTSNWSIKINTFIDIDLL
jgi:hypothetical protein